MRFVANINAPRHQYWRKLPNPRSRYIRLSRRDSSNTIALNDLDVTRQHATLVANSEGHRLHDLQGTNGTIVNDQKIATEVLLRTGDTILVGSTVLTYDRT